MSFRGKPRTKAGLAFVLAAAFCAVPADIAEAAVSEIIVARQPGLPAAQRADVRSDAGVRLARPVPMLKNTEVVAVDSSDMKEALKQLDSDPRVRWAQPNSRVYAVADAPNDPDFAFQWGLFNSSLANSDIGILDAWQRTSGAGVLVGVADTGIESNNPDLSASIAARFNGREIPDNLVDDDSNGKIDDAAGWNWIGNSSNTLDDAGHGTHVAGIIAAQRGNGLGISGVAPESKLVPLKVLDSLGGGNMDDLASAFAYAGEMGIRVVNASVSGNLPVQQAMVDAIKAHPNTLYVAAAGNNGFDLSKAGPVGDSAPCNTPLPNMLCVGAVGATMSEGPNSNWACPAGPSPPRNFCLAEYSNFSAPDGMVKIYAPGSGIVSYWLGGSLSPKIESGTSMAAPHVAGVAALVAALHPTWSGEQIRRQILITADTVRGDWRFPTAGQQDFKVLDAARATTDVDDEDWDGVKDVVDNCPLAVNPDQRDLDGDGVGDVCDPTPRGPDPDQDGVGAMYDNCPDRANPTQMDWDVDGLGDECDPTPHGPDPDHDGVGEFEDNCPTVANRDQRDFNHNHVGDACDGKIGLRLNRATAGRNQIRLNLWSSADGKLTITARRTGARKKPVRRFVLPMRHGTTRTSIPLGHGRWRLELILGNRFGVSAKLTSRRFRIL